LLKTLGYYLIWLSIPRSRNTCCTRFCAFLSELFLSHQRDVWKNVVVNSNPQNVN